MSSPFLLLVHNNDLEMVGVISIYIFLLVVRSFFHPNFYTHCVNFYLEF